MVSSMTDPRKSAEKIQTSYRIDRLLKDEFQIACIRRHVSETDAVEEAIQAWIAGRPDIPAGAPEDAPVLMRMSEYIQRAPAGGWVRQAVLAWIDEQAKKPKPGSATPRRRNSGNPGSTAS
jgi:hypothetical protein